MEGFCRNDLAKQPGSCLTGKQTLFLQDRGLLMIFSNTQNGRLVRRTPTEKAGEEGPRRGAKQGKSTNPAPNQIKLSHF